MTDALAEYAVKEAFLKKKQRHSSKETKRSANFRG